MVESLIEIMKYVLPAFIVFLTAYFLIKSFLKKEQQKLDHQLIVNTKQDILPLRLTAYERLSVFLERINPNNLIIRVLQPKMTVNTFQRALVQTIRTEYEHNISQQIYVSNQIWSAVGYSKDQLIKDINILSGTVPPNVPAKELSKRILEFYLTREEPIPSQEALKLIKNEVKKLY